MDQPDYLVYNTSVRTEPHCGNRQRWIIVAILFPFGLISPILGWSSYVFLIVVFAAAILFWSMNPFRISQFSWLISFLPFIFVTAFVFSRSLFRNYIDWHGRRYYPGKGGVVLCVEEAKPSFGLEPTRLARIRKDGGRRTGFQPAPIGRQTFLENRC